MKDSPGFFLFSFLVWIAYATGGVLRGRQSSDPPGYVITPSNASTLPEPTAGNASTTRPGKFEWHFRKTCTPEQMANVTEAWDDSKFFADAFASWKPKADYQAAVDMYMGTRSTYSNYQGHNFPEQIQDTVERMLGLYDGKSTYGHAYLWVYCNEDSFWFKKCGQADGPSVFLAWEDEDNFFNNWYITFCPPFFDPKWAIPLIDLVDKIEKHAVDKTIMELYTAPPGSRAYVFFHEAFHMSQIVTSPGALDYAYSPEGVCNLSRDYNTDRAVYNADSWAMTGLAIWAQQLFELDVPPYPDRYHENSASYDSSLSTANNSQPLDILYVETEGVIPEGASPVPKGSPYFVDPNLWDIYAPVSGLGLVSSTPSTSLSATSTPPPTTTTTSSTSAAAPSCLGNQVEGSCTAGTYPSLAPYSGVQAPVCEKANGAGTQPRLNSASASSAAATYCSELIASSTVLNPTAAPSAPAIVGNGAAENDGHLAVAVIFDVSSCPQDKSNSTLDFAGLGQEECEMDLFGAIGEMCSQDSQWPGYNPDFTIEGGAYLADCGLWSVTGQT